MPVPGIEPGVIVYKTIVLAVKLYRLYALDRIRTCEGNSHSISSRAA